MLWNEQARREVLFVLLWVLVLALISIIRPRIPSSQASDRFGSTTIPALHALLIIVLTKRGFLILLDLGLLLWGDYVSKVGEALHVDELAGATMVTND